MGNVFGVMWTPEQVVPIVNMFKANFPQSQIVGKILRMTYDDNSIAFIERFNDDAVVVANVMPTDS